MSADAALQGEKWAPSVGARCVALSCNARPVRTLGSVGRSLVTGDASGARRVCPSRHVTGVTCLAPACCRHRAAVLGASVTAVITALVETNALQRLRSAQGGDRARRPLPRPPRHRLRSGAAGPRPAYRSTKRILAAGTDRHRGAAQCRPAHLHGEAPNVRSRHQAPAMTRTNSKPASRRSWTSRLTSTHPNAGRTRSRGLSRRTARPQDIADDERARGSCKLGF
jgi:hypothetical protein